MLLPTLFGIKFIYYVFGYAKLLHNLNCVVTLLLSHLFARNKQSIGRKVAENHLI